METLDGYFLYGVDGEMLMVIRGADEELMTRIIDKLSRARDKDIKALGIKLEEHFSERQDDGGRASKARPKDKKKGSQGVGGLDRESQDPINEPEQGS